MQQFQLSADYERCLTPRTCPQPRDPARPPSCVSLREVVCPVFSPGPQDRTTAVCRRGGIFHRGRKLAAGAKPQTSGGQTDTERERGQQRERDLETKIERERDSEDKGSIIYEWQVLSTETKLKHDQETGIPLRHTG